MKQLFISLLMVIVSPGLFAQTESFDSNNLDLKKNEVKINLPMAIFGSFPEISYERVLQEDLTVGASAGFNLEKDKEKVPFNWILVPYARWFFGGNRTSMQKMAAGFFIEANGGLLSKAEEVTLEYDDKTNTYSSYSSKKSKIGAGLGVGIGWKYVTKNNWVGEVFWGMGRDFVNNSVYPHAGISIGKRF